jgi:hypothetical protein
MAPVKQNSAARQNRIEWPVETLDHSCLARSVEVSGTGNVAVPAPAVCTGVARSFRLLQRQGPPQRMATDFKLIGELHFAVLPGPQQRPLLFSARRPVGPKMPKIVSSVKRKGFPTLTRGVSSPAFCITEKSTSSQQGFMSQDHPLRNMGTVPEPENSLYENRSQRGLGDCREEAHPVWNRACQERGQNQQSQANHQRAPKYMNESDCLVGGGIHRLSGNPL